LKGAPKEAIVAIEPALKKYPNDPTVRLVHGQALIKSGKIAEGAAELEIAAKLGQKNIPVLIEAARSFVEAKMNERAIDLLGRPPNSTQNRPSLTRSSKKIYLDMGKPTRRQRSARRSRN